MISADGTQAAIGSIAAAFLTGLGFVIKAVWDGWKDWKDRRSRTDEQKDVARASLITITQSVQNDALARSEAEVLRKDLAISRQEERIAALEQHVASLAAEVEELRPLRGEVRVLREENTRLRARIVTLEAS